MVATSGGPGLGERIGRAIGKIIGGCLCFVFVIAIVFFGVTLALVLCRLPWALSSYLIEALLR